MYVLVNSNKSKLISKCVENVTKIRPKYIQITKNMFLRRKVRFNAKWNLIACKPLDELYGFWAWVPAKK